MLVIQTSQITASVSIFFLLYPHLLCPTPEQQENAQLFPKLLGNIVIFHQRMVTQTHEKLMSFSGT